MASKIDQVNVRGPSNQHRCRRICAHVRHRALLSPMASLASPFRTIARSNARRTRLRTTCPTIGHPTRGP